MHSLHPPRRLFIAGLVLAGGIIVALVAGSAVTTAFVGYAAPAIPLPAATEPGAAADNMALPQQAEVAVPSSLEAAAPSGNAWITHASQAVKPATVTVMNQTAQGAMSGAGLIIDANGDVVTSYRLVAAGPALQVLLDDGSKTHARPL
jgi:S1-C subfamily serine protease